MRRRDRRSRLARRLESKTRKSLFFSLLGIVIFLFILVKFGIPLLVNFTLFISNPNATKDIVKNDNSAFVAPPVLNPLPIATNSANIEISGSASVNQTISLYINDDLKDKNQTQKDGNFSFNETLSPGGNVIKVKATVAKKDSDFSQTSSVIFKTEPPVLNLNSPSDGQSFSKDQNKAEIKGTTDTQVKITVNGFWAIIDENNNFSYTLPLQNGDNQIKVVATDVAGNTTEKDIKVNYAP